MKPKTNHSQASEATGGSAGGGRSLPGKPGGQLNRYTERMSEANPILPEFAFGFYLARAKYHPQGRPSHPDTHKSCGSVGGACQWLSPSASASPSPSPSPCESQAPSGPAILAFSARVSAVLGETANRGHPWFRGQCGGVTLEKAGGASASSKRILRQLWPPNRFQFLPIFEPRKVRERHRVLCHM